MRVWCGLGWSGLVESRGREGGGWLDGSLYNSHQAELKNKGTTAHGSSQVLYYACLGRGEPEEERIYIVKGMLEGGGELWW